MRNLVLSLLAAIVLAACGGGISSSTSPAVAPVLLIEAYGDSTTQGWQSVNGQDVITSRGEPADLQTVVGVPVTNEGVRGTQAVQLLQGTDGRHAPWATQMQSSQATAVLLNFGLNEAFFAHTAPPGTPQQSPADFRDSLTQLVRIARAGGKTVLLQEPNPTCEPVREAVLPDYVQAVRDVAAAESVPLVRAYDKMLALDWRPLLSDCLHPTDAGYALKASYTGAVLRPLLITTSPPARP